jgi:hypothetical protein
LELIKATTCTPLAGFPASVTVPEIEPDLACAFVATANAAKSTSAFEIE